MTTVTKNKKNKQKYFPPLEGLWVDLRVEGHSEARYERVGIQSLGGKSVLWEPFLPFTSFLRSHTSSIHSRSLTAHAAVLFHNTPKIIRAWQHRRIRPQRSPLAFLSKLWQHVWQKGCRWLISSWIVGLICLNHQYRRLQTCCFTFRIRRRKSWWSCANGCWSTCKMETAAWRGGTAMVPRSLRMWR